MVGETFVIIYVHTLIGLRFFSLISKVLINIHKYGYKIICIYNHESYLVCSGINVVPRLVSLMSCCLDISILYVPPMFLSRIMGCHGNYEHSYNQSTFIF